MYTNSEGNILQRGIISTAQST